MSKKALPLPSFPFVVLDTETTGFVPRVHRVIEYASAEYRDGKLKEEYEQLLSTKEIPPVVQVITRITPAHLEGKPSFEEKRDEIATKIPEDCVVVGQNTNFDIGMLKGEGIDLSARPMLDTSMLASLVFPELDSYSLGYLSRVLTLNHNPPHRALGDVRATLELLGKCWERLLELPVDAYKEMKTIAAKAPPGLKLLLESVPESTAKTAPAWMKPIMTTYASASSDALTIEPPASGVIVREESLDPGELQRIVEGALAIKKGPRTWIAVKNLRLALERLPEGITDRVRVLHPPHLLADPDARERLFAQDTLTNDEVTLSLKLRWFPSETRMGIALHGGEESVWNGKVAATTESAVYRDQFQKLPSVVLVEHRDLLQMLEDDEHVGHDELVSQPAHVIVDDASMLEDTATKAYGWYVSIETLRAAAEGQELLTRFLDTLQLWIERTRQFQDLRYLTSSDLSSPETQGLLTLLDDILKNTWTAQVSRTLTHMRNILETKNLARRIAWIEQNRQGNQYIQSVPERIGMLLKDMLFSRIPTTLLIPSGCAAILPEILPTGEKAPESKEKPEFRKLPIDYIPDMTLEDLLEQPPAGKTILLLSSRSQIDDAFVKHTEALEAKGIALICQGSSGGQGRMRSEFVSAPGTAVWILTPWMFESVDLPPKTADRLVLATLPFDHPGHAVLSRRSQAYRDPFGEYALPRLLHRLFRLLRTYARFRKDGGLLLLDGRLQTKSYGQKILTYLSQFSNATTDLNAAGAGQKADTPAAPKTVKAATPKPKPKKAAAPKKKGDESQLTMF